MEHHRETSGQQRADERCHEQRVDDRLVDRLKRADKGPVVGRAQPGHDRVGVEAEDTCHESRGDGGDDERRASKELQAVDAIARAS